MRLSLVHQRVLAIAAVAAALLALWLLPRWQTAPTQTRMSPSDLLLVQNQLRQTLLFLLVGGAIVAGLAAVARRLAASEQAARDALEVARQGQRGDRFASTVALLTDHRVAVRVGAVYALGQLADDATQHWPIMELLCAFLREHASWEPDRPPADTLPLEVQAALNVLGRRNRAHEGDERLDLRHLDLRGADLNGLHLERAILREARLDGASLQGAHLEGADLHGAHLRGADLVEAHLEGADLRQAHLETAYLVDAHLEGAHLGNALLSGAYLGGAHLEGADLGGADLDGAYLYQAHFDGAFLQGAQAMSAIGMHRDERESSERTSAPGDEAAPSRPRHAPTPPPTPISLRARRLPPKKRPESKDEPEPQRETKKT